MSGQHAGVAKTHRRNAVLANAVNAACILSMGAMGAALFLLWWY